MRNRPALEAADVAKIIAAAKAEAEKSGWDVAIAVVNEGGWLLHAERMETMDGMSADVAVAKARTAALTKRPSKDFEDRIKDRPGFLGFPGHLLGIQGGLPLTYQGQHVGAIGVSGRPSHEDEIVARAGLAAIEG
jgi:glc operon protein GlcG